MIVLFLAVAFEGLYPALMPILSFGREYSKPAISMMMFPFFTDIALVNAFVAPLSSVSSEISRADAASFGFVSPQRSLASDVGMTAL